MKSPVKTRRKGVQQDAVLSKQVYAQLSGPQLSVILDVEPMRQGEKECAGLCGCCTGFVRTLRLDNEALAGQRPTYIMRIA